MENTSLCKYCTCSMCNRNSPDKLKRKSLLYKNITRSCNISPRVLLNLLQFFYLNSTFTYDCMWIRGGNTAFHLSLYLLWAMLFSAVHCQGKKVAMQRCRRRYNRSGRGNVCWVFDRNREYYPRLHCALDAVVKMFDI